MPTPSHYIVPLSGPTYLLHPGPFHCTVYRLTMPPPSHCIVPLSGPTYSLHPGPFHCTVYRPTMPPPSHCIVPTGPLSGPVLTSSPPIFKPRLPGDNLTLPCSAEGTPPPTISWLHDRTPINLTASQHIQQVQHHTHTPHHTTLPTHPSVVSAHLK